MKFLKSEVRVALKKRRGSLLIVVAYGTLMALVVLGMLRVASSIYSTSQTSASIYADIQNYRAISELCCYRFVRDLTTVTAEKDMSVEWVNVTQSYVETGGMRVLKESVCKDTEPTVWKVEDMTTALTAINVDDYAVIATLLSKLQNVTQSFKLEVDDSLFIDWDDAISVNSVDQTYGLVKPFSVKVTLTVRGETLVERFIVKDMYFRARYSEIEVSGRPHKIVNMQFEEGENGVRIYREGI